MKQRILMFSITCFVSISDSPENTRTPSSCGVVAEPWWLDSHQGSPQSRSSQSGQLQENSHSFLKMEIGYRQILQQTKFYLTKRRYCVVINYFFNAKQHHNSIKKIIYVSIICMIHLNQTVVCNLTGNFCIRRLHHLAWGPTHQDAWRVCFHSDCKCLLSNRDELF